MLGLNPDSLETLTGMLEPALKDLAQDERVQFERTGYFMKDPVDSSDATPIFNRIVTLRDSWAKLEKQALQGQ